MKAKLIIEGKEIEIEISEEEYKKLQPSEEKKTGYERVSESDIYFYANSRGYVETCTEDCYDIDNEYYESANYYSDKTVAENNARADKLMRQLRRFAVEHRERGVDFNNTKTEKYYIYYNYDYNELRTTFMFYAKHFGVIQFDSKETIETTIKLTINIAEDKYKFYYYGEYRYRYNTMIKDLGIQYEIYENEMDFYKDCHKAEFYKDYNDKYFLN